MISSELIKIENDLFCIKSLQMDNNTYLIVNKKQCIVIDPSFAYDEICQFLEKYSLTLQGIVLTHCHFDHSWSASKLAKKYLCSVYIHELDKNTYLKYDCSNWANEKIQKINKIEWFTTSKLRIGDFNFDILLSPGHTSGSICIYYKQYLFTGDTLFVHGFGRYDFPNSNFDDLKESIHQIYIKYQKSTLILPGHGEWEKLKNIPIPL